MEMFRYDQAATIILMIFVLVVGVVQLSSRAPTCSAVAANENRTIESYLRP